MPAPDAMMLFAAGFGTRMGALTRDRPKPLIKVGGKALIDHALDLADEIALPRIVVNVHYHADQIRQHLADRSRVQISDESAEILETGGGLRAARPLLGPDPVFVLNSDGVWTGKNPLRELAKAWDPARMDVLLLLLPAAKFTAHRGTGDFLMDAEGRLERARGRPGLSYIGAHISRTDQLEEFTERAFSLNQLWDAAIGRGRAYGLLHRGGCADVGYPEAIPLAETLLSDG
jgi:MurNAc alpha-1-phosphate uridylyltransferase